MSDSKDPTSPFAPLDNKGWLDPMPRMDLSPGIDAKDAEITRLRAALADAQVVGFAAGVEAAVVVIRKSCPECRGTGHRDSGGTYPWGEGIFLACDCCDDIRALTPPDATAAAARVLLDVWPTDASFEAAFNACAASYHGGDEMQDVMDRTRTTVSAALRAIAGDTP